VTTRDAGDHSSGIANVSRAIAALVTMILVAACSSTSDGPEQEPRDFPDRPNVLLLITDDQRASGTMEESLPKTLRYFQAGGTRFTQAFATTPLCCPSRASILSGRYAHRHGVLNNNEGPKMDERATLQRYLQDNGYFTAAIGKYLNRWPRNLDPRYFDHWAIMLHNYYYKSLFNVDGDNRDLHGYTNDFIERKTIGLLDRFEEKDSRPWFLYVGTTAAHAPYQAEARYEGAPTPRYNPSPGVKERNISDKPFFQFGRRADFRQVRRKQLRTLYSVDDTVDKLMKKLQALDEDRDTIAFFVSDNGMLWGEHGLVSKRYPYIPSVKIPFFVRWPGIVGAGKEDSRLVANIDIAATVLDVVGDAGAFDVDGRSIFEQGMREKLLLEHWKKESDDNESEIPDWASILTPAYQYVEYYRPSEEKIATEFFDRAKDPWQLRNLLGDRRKANDPDVRKLSAELADLRDCSGDSCP
jgi:arylsulfatase A-like enzyme